MVLLRMALWLAGVTGWLRAPLSDRLGLVARRAGGGVAVRGVLEQSGGLGAKLPARLLPCLGTARIRQQAGVLLWLLLTVPLAAQGAGTPAGTGISNVAVLDGTPSNATAFLVDNRVKPEVVHETGVLAPVNAGGTAWTAFLVTNAGNRAQDYLLTASNVASGGSVFSATDNFDPTACQALVDANNNGLYEAGTDTAGFIDELAAGATRRVFMVCTVPGGQANNDVAVLSLMATTHDAGAPGTLGAQTVKVTGPNTSAVDATFTDTAGSETLDTVSDGRHSARGGFIISAAVSPGADLKATKAGPAQVAPGGAITWTVVVENQGTGVANNVLFTDTVPAGVTGVTASCAAITIAGVCGTVTVGATGAGGTPVSVTSSTLPAGGKLAVTLKGTAPASGTLVNTALVQIPSVADPTPADNTSSVSTLVTAAAGPTGTITGRVWLDSDHNRQYSSGEFLYNGFTVVVYDATGVTELARVTTNASGAYSVPSLPAGVQYQLEFRDPSGNVIFGLPVSSDTGAGFAYTQTCGDMWSLQAPHVVSQGVASAGACYAVTGGGSTSQVQNNGRTLIMLQPGDNVVEQSLPLDPAGVVYDSVTRLPVAGATVTFNGPAGFNPATHLLGGIANQNQLTGATGFYQFILVGGAPAGTYTITITPPAGYSFPSGTIPANPTLDPTGLGVGGIYAVQAQFGPPTGAQPTTYHLSFDLAVGDPDVINNHIPLDPGAAGAPSLLLTKQASKSQAGIGEFVQYTLTLRNSGGVVAAAPLVVSDVLPAGFRYRAGSTRLNGALAADPAIAGDGRTLTFADVTAGAGLAAGGSLTLKYVAEITSGTPQGAAVNSARAANAIATSNVATATVQVQEDVFKSRAILMGRVIDGVCDMDEAQKLKGIAGARVFMEDGTYVLTDKDGKWHVDNVKPGVHVVQLDVDSLPEGYEPALCEQTARHAGRNWSQFVEVQGGTLWRADFFAVKKGGAVSAKAAPVLNAQPGKITQRVDALAEGGTVRYTLEVQGGSPALGVSSTVMLPKGAEAAGVKIDGVAQPGLKSQDGVLVLRLGDQTEPFVRRVEFSVTGLAAEARLRASSAFKGENGRVTRLPLAEVPVPEAGKPFTGEVKEALLPPVPPEALKAAAGRTQAAAPVTPVANAAASPVAPRQADMRIYAPGSEKFDGAWLNSAAPGFEVVYPPESFAASVAATKFFVKHDPAHKLTLTVNGEPVSALDFEGRSSNAARTVAVTKWAGIPLKNGANRFEVVALDQDGKEAARLVRDIRLATAAVKAEFLPAQSQLLADGRNPVVVAVRFTDSDGKPARHGGGGEFSVNAPHRGWRAEQEYAVRPTVNMGNANQYVVREDGIALIQLAPTMQSGEVVLRFNLSGGVQEVRAWLKPGQRDWILVGLAEGTLAHKAVSGNLQALPDDLNGEKYQKDGRVAFYAKGMVAGEYLLTAAYDTAKAKARPGELPAYFGQGVERERFYTIYGDASEARHDAASIRKLYLKIERDAFYALFGDFDTGLSVTELARYQRVMNGFKSEFRGEQFGYTAFATSSAQAFVRDELRADGTSGYYALSRQKILPGSERVVLETRDRFASHSVLKTVALTRAIDYQMDYTAGTILLRDPAAAFDASFNPSYLVVNYESQDSSQDRRLTAGGRLSYKLGDGLEVGATGVHEGNVGAKGDLAGVDLKYQFDERTQFRAEYAASRRENFAAGGGAAGVPAQASGSAYLMELTRRGEKVQARAYFRQQDAGFGLGQGSGGLGGVQTYGAEMQLRLSERLALDVKGQRDVVQASTTPGATTGDRVLGEAQLRYTGDGYQLSGGLRGVQDQDLAGQPRSVSQLTAGASTSLLDGTLALRANAELPLAGNNGVADYPRRLILGAEYRIGRNMSAFASQEFTAGQQDKGFATRIGLKSQPWEGADSTSAVGIEQGGGQSRVVHSSNFTQSLKLTDELTLTAGMDSVRTLARRNTAVDTRINNGVPAASGTYSTGGSGSFSNSGVPSRGVAALEDYLAVNTGLSWTDGPWGASVRGEVRKGDAGNKLNLSGGVHRDIADGEALAMALSLSRSTGGQQLPLQALNSTTGAAFTESRALHADLSLHYAFRPVGSKWIVLDRLDFILDEIEGGGAVTQGRKLVNNFNANYLYDRRTQLALQYGAKYVFDTIDGQGYEGFTDLIGVEARRDLNSQWDLGLRAAVLHSWTADNYLLSYGLQLGFSPVQNLWLGLGYNFKGFRDEDFSGANYTGKGWYLSFRYKFDQGEKDIASRRRKMFDEAAR